MTLCIKQILIVTVLYSIMLVHKVLLLFVLVQGYFALDSSRSNKVSLKDVHGRLASTSTENCEKLLEPELTRKIATYQDAADKIIDLIVNGDFKRKSYNELVELVDRYPIRMSGDKALEDSIDYIMERMRGLGLHNVRGEQVLAPHWIRGQEEATMLQPIKRSLPILGLGTSVGTPEEGITAPVLVVKSFEELEKRKDEVRGKIVVFNQGWIDIYGNTFAYRAYGASHAAQLGAVAVLVQSIAPFSLNTLHTGLQEYWNNITHIPAASITQEDADYLYRLHKKGDQILINLKMLDANLPMTTSRNVIGELMGKTTPQEYVAVSGHIDSWDVGQGAMDDAGGVVISVIALAALKQLNMTPNRTLQSILWTSEEFRLFGAADFVKKHKGTLANYSVVFESDFGMFKPVGVDFFGSEEAGCIVNEVLKLVKSINASEFNRYETFVPADIALLQAEGVPGVSLNGENDKYFWYHHSAADSISMIDSDELDLNAALLAVSSFVLADIPIKLPRDEVKVVPNDFFKAKT